MRKTKIKWISTGCALVLCSAVLAGCGSSAATGTTSAAATTAASTAATAAASTAASTAASAAAETTAAAANEAIIVKAASEGKVGNWGLGNEYEIQALL